MQALGEPHSQWMCGFAVGITAISSASCNRLKVPDCDPLFVIARWLQSGALTVHPRQQPGPVVMVQCANRNAAQLANSWMRKVLMGLTMNIVEYDARGG